MEDEKTRITFVKKGKPDVAVDMKECLVVIYGRTIGQKYELTTETITLGRDVENTIVVDKDSVSRRHAKIELTGTDRIITDLGSTNGTYVNDELIREKVLRNGDFIKIGDSIFKFLSGGNIETAYHEEIYRMTIIDGLTQVHNKRYLLEFLEKEIARCRRYKRDLTVIMLDIDHFKKINDDFGHLTGDFVLKEMARILKKRIRKDELFARYGGEEFTIVLPETGRSGAMEFAEQVRKIVETHTFVFESNTIPITISLGCGYLHDGINDPLEIIKLADTNLYAAKKSGRNRVVC